MTETRLSGAIQAAKSFIFGTVTDAETFGDLKVTAAETAKLEKFDKTGVKSTPSWFTDSAATEGSAPVAPKTPETPAAGK